VVGIQKTISINIIAITDLKMSFWKDSLSKKEGTFAVYGMEERKWLMGAWGHLSDRRERKDEGSQSNQMPMPIK